MRTTRSLPRCRSATCRTSTGWAGHTVASVGSPRPRGIRKADLRSPAAAGARAAGLGRLGRQREFGARRTADDELRREDGPRRRRAPPLDALDDERGRHPADALARLGHGGERHRDVAQEWIVVEARDGQVLRDATPKRPGRGDVVDLDGVQVATDDVAVDEQHREALARESCEELAVWFVIDRIADQSTHALGEDAADPAGLLFATPAAAPTSML